MLIGNIVDRIVGDPIVIFFIVVLGIVFFLGWRGDISRQSTPSLLTSIGILGTFVGVVVALVPLEFTPEKMNESVEQLLRGMSTAFLTSMFGLTASVIFKSLISRRRSLPKTSPELFEDMVERLDAVKQAIAGEGDSSLVTQMQKLRDENRDGFRQLSGLSDTIRETLGANLTTLVEEIREIIGNQLGESLQGLIERIEEALIRQFGQTFVQFNEAVQALKQWQEDHRRHVEQLTEAFEETARGIETIRRECEHIPRTMEQLRPVIERADRQIEDLSARLGAFAEIQRQAENAFPEIHNRLNRVIEDLQSSAQGFHGLEEVIRRSFQQAEANVREIAQGHTENVEKMAGSMRETMEKAQREAAGRVGQVIDQYIRQIHGEIDRVATAWGENLVSIAQRCAETIEEVEGRRR